MKKHPLKTAMLVFILLITYVPIIWIPHRVKLIHNRFAVWRRQ